MKSFLDAMRGRDACVTRAILAGVKSPRLHQFSFQRPRFGMAFGRGRFRADESEAGAFRFVADHDVRQARAVAAGFRMVSAVIDDVILHRVVPVFAAAGFGAKRDEVHADPGHSLSGFQANK